MKRRPLCILALSWVVGAAVVFGPATARSDALKRLSNQIESTNLKTATAAARALGRMRSPKALEILMENLLLGARPKLGLEMIKAVGQHANPKAFHLMAHYTRHRDEAVRAEAIKAVGRMNAPNLRKKVFALALRALRDGASAVRAEGARLITKLKRAGLGAAQLAKAERLLLHLLLVRKDQRSARIALSVIGTVRTARFLAVHLKDLTERIVTTLCSTFLKRADFDPEPDSVWVVKTLGKLTGPEAIAALMEYIRDSENKRKVTLSVTLAKSIAEK
jgi:HEAT repeat protein